MELINLYLIVIIFTLLYSYVISSYIFKYDSKKFVVINTLFLISSIYFLIKFFKTIQETNFNVIFPDF